MIDSGAWTVDAERGLVIGRRFGKPLGYRHRSYIEICVWDATTQRRYQLRAHRVIWEHVHGPIADPAAEINHKNGRKHDNRIANLELLTQLGNSQHAYANGLIPPQRVGQRSPRSKLSDAQAREIKQLLAEDRGQRFIAARYGVSQGTISLIKSGRRYANV